MSEKDIIGYTIRLAAMLLGAGMILPTLVIFDCGLIFLTHAQELLACEIGPVVLILVALPLYIHELARKETQE